MKYVFLVTLLLVGACFALPRHESGGEQPTWPQALPELDLPRLHFEYQIPDSYIAKLAAAHPTLQFKQVQAKVTAYCPCKVCCGPFAHGRTATGVYVANSPYGLAVSKRYLHLRLHVPGYLPESRPFHVWKPDDTGGAMETSANSGVFHVDVRFKNHAWAEQWGVKYMTVYVVTSQ